jgi:threonine dehydrogenase-like Zn-dependent dehydrogenase
MKAGQITARGRVELVNVEPPRSPLDGEVVVAVETACLCGSDIPYFSEPQERYPLSAGLSLHEIVGRITASASPTFHVGERVLAMPVGLRGLFEQLLIADDRLVKIDESGRVDNDAAVLSQPTATVLSALSSLPSVLGLTVAVVGQGPIGQLFNACVSSLGAARIIGIDALEERTGRSCEFGATDTICSRRADPIDALGRATDGAMADIVVEAVGHEEQAFDLSVALARDHGRLLYFGVPPDRAIAVDWNAAFRKSLTIHTSVPSDLRPFVRIAMRWIAQGRIDVRRLVTHRYDLADIQQAFERYRDRTDGAMKVFIDFPS